MAVLCRTITQPSHVVVRQQQSEYVAAQGGWFPTLRQRFGDTYSELTIFCLGYRESLLLRIADVERWYRDYEVEPLGTNASPPSSYVTTNAAAARAAEGAGAVYFMKCYFGDNDWAAEEQGRIIDIRDTNTWDNPLVYVHEPELSLACERCCRRPATWRSTDTRVQPWREQRLCASCTAAELALARHGATVRDSLSEMSLARRHSLGDDLRDDFERIERWWNVLPAPAEVNAALERCRGLLKAVRGR
jgi:hypothetical protein